MKLFSNSERTRRLNLFFPPRQDWEKPFYRGVAAELVGFVRLMSVEWRAANGSCVVVIAGGAN